jgi:hypothetical protein
MSIYDELPATRAAEGARCLICGHRQRDFFAPKPGVEANLCFNCAFPGEKPRCDCCGVRVDVEVTDLGPLCLDCVNGNCPRCEDDCFCREGS